MNRRGLPFIVCAPSGAGKTTLLARLREEFHLPFSVSCTTRAPREGEVDGRDYHFIDIPTFESMRRNHEFAEWAQVHGNCYGTPLAPVRERLGAGEDILFDIDVQGAAQLSLRLPDARFVFIFPPSLAVLRERLVHRGTDSAEVIERRLSNARRELGEAHWFDAWIVNDDLEAAYDRLRAFYLACTCSPSLCPVLVAEMLAEDK